MSGSDAAIVAHHQASLTAYVRSLVDSPPVAADIVQETWARAIPSLRSGKVENPRAFLYRVARNLVNDGARHHRNGRPGWAARRWPPPSPTTPRPRAPCAGPEPVADRAGSGRGPASALPRNLHAAQAGGLDQNEIAARLGITRGAVEKQLRHALLVLATRMGEIEGAL
jgi:RNA polymerase sigma-70 factor (ECF subfamily)